MREQITHRNSAPGGSAIQAVTSFGLCLFLMAGALPVGAEPAPTPAGQPPAAGAEPKPAGDAKPGPASQPAAGAPGDAPKPGDQPAGAAPTDEKPDAGKPARQPGPPLAITGVASLEIVPRSYDETLDFYVSVLGLQEGEMSGGEGERQCTLIGRPGPLRIMVREQPGKAVRAKRPAWLGVHPAPLSEIVAEAAGLKEPKGVVVEDVVPQGPAAQAGLLKGDIILAVEGKDTPDMETLSLVVRGFSPGKKVLVTVWRERKKQDIPMDLPASPFPEQLSPVILHLQVTGLDDYYRELLKRMVKVYAEPRDVPSGGRVLEIVDPNDVMVVLEEPAPAAEKPEKPAAKPADKPAVLK